MTFPTRSLLRATVPLALLACQEISISPSDKGGDPNDVDETDAASGLCSFDVQPRATPTLEGCSDYSIGAFVPWVEWSAVAGKGSTALPVVADLDGDNRPEVLVNVTPLLGLTSPGELWVLNGDGTVKWKKRDVDLGYGAPVAVGDLDGDKVPEIVGVRSYGTALPGFPVKYTVVVLDNVGTKKFESEKFTSNDFDYATAPILSDMDHDGSPEIVAGRVILNADATTRAVGTHGHGSWGELPAIGKTISEGAVSAVADLDLDGFEEVIVGDAIYNLDGTDKWFNDRRHDGMVAVANVDDDPEGEFLVSSYGTIRAHDTNGDLIWGPKELLCVVPDCYDSGQPTTGPQPSANILSVPSVADIDHDGKPEVVVAGGSQIVAFNAESGSQLWSNVVHDISGASGASFFDFDANGTVEVVYIDEVAMYAFDGETGETVFQSDKHASPTMMDYPTIADVDADGAAEIVVAHFGWSYAVSVYGAADGNWAPTRRVWNQHAYSVGNVNDDLTIPTTQVQGFTTHNTYHAANVPDGAVAKGKVDLQANIAEVCEAACDAGHLEVAVQVVNKSPEVDADAGVKVSLYAKQGSSSQLVATLSTTTATPKGSLGEALIFEVPADVASHATALEVVVDDDGTTPIGVLPECIEGDNTATIRGPFCQ